MSDEKAATPTTDPRVVASRASMAAAMKSPEHMKAWLSASGRRWLVFNAIDLVDSLTFPEGCETFQVIIEAYRDYRRTLETGRVEVMTHPDTKESVPVPITKCETLEIEELDRAIRYLVSDMYQRKPDWRLDGDAL